MNHCSGLLLVPGRAPRRPLCSDSETRGIAFPSVFSFAMHDYLLDDGSPALRRHIISSRGPAPLTPEEWRT